MLTEPDPRPLVIYHGGCPDGFTAAYIAAEHWRAAEGRSLNGPPAVELLAATYGGDEPPDVTGRLVYVLDFCYSLDVMTRLALQAAHLDIYDHHQSSVGIIGFARDNVVVVHDQHRSGAGITADILRGNRSPFVDYIEDRDLRRKQLYGSDEVSAVVASTDHTLDAWRQLEQTPIPELIDAGRGILRYVAKEIATAVSNSRPMSVGGFLVPMANCSWSVGSEVAGELALGWPFAGYYFDIADARQFGLHSAPDGMDVAAIAEQYGGGGHKHASGFRTPLPHDPV